MYANLGVHWASSIPAFLALACVPFPFLFMRYGKAIRMRCKYAAEAADVLQRMRANQLQQEQGQVGDEVVNNIAVDEMDEDDAIEEANEHELEKKATRIGGGKPLHHDNGAATVLASSSRNGSDDEKADAGEKI